MINMIDMATRCKTASYLAIVGVIAAATNCVSAESSRTQVGTLSCSLSSSVDMVVGSRRNGSWTFRAGAGYLDEPYTGTMTRFGVDVGATTGGVIVWTVFAVTARHRKKLAATYT